VARLGAAAGDVVEEVGRLVDGHPQDVGDVAVAIGDGERLGLGTNSDVCPNRRISLRTST
jgi:hypothetical protein